jgi:hypothetical protein
VGSIAVRWPTSRCSRRSDSEVRSTALPFGLDLWRWSNLGGVCSGPQNGDPFCTRSDQVSSRLNECGGCRCGAIRFVISGEPNRVVVCHCGDCRRSVGAQSVAWLVLPLASYAISSGSPATHVSSPEVVRTFCGSCGTSLTYSHSNSPEGIDVTVASLDDPGRFPPTKTSFEAERIEWYSPI